MKSKFFWFGAILLAIIPVLAIDITLHSLQWQKDVRGQIITVTQNVYPLDRQQKAAALDRVFEINKTILTLVSIKGLAILICLVLGIYFLRRYHQTVKSKLWLTIAGCVCLLICSVVGKLFFPDLRHDNKVKYLTLAPNDYTLSNLYNKNFKGKVVYVDFWGTTCGSCLVEFRDYTPYLKDRYVMRDDMVYLYISIGNRYMWKQQIEEYNVKGYHVFVDDEQYAKLYRQSVNDAHAQIVMPRYLIIDKSGKIVIPDAPRPSGKSKLYVQIDKYLTN